MPQPSFRISYPDFSWILFRITAYAAGRQDMRYDEMARRMLCRAFFSSRETCAWEIPTS